MIMRTLLNVLFASLTIVLCVGCGEKVDEVFLLSEFPVNPHPVDLDTVPHRYIGRVDNICGTISKSSMTSFGGSFFCVNIQDTSVSLGISCVYHLNNIIDSSYMGKQVKMTGEIYYALAYSYLNMVVYVYVLADKRL